MTVGAGRAAVNGAKAAAGFVADHPREFLAAGQVVGCAAAAVGTAGVAAVACTAASIAGGALTTLEVGKAVMRGDWGCAAAEALYFGAGKGLTEGGVKLIARQRAAMSRSWRNGRRGGYYDMRMAPGSERTAKRATGAGEGLFGFADACGRGGGLGESRSSDPLA